RAAAVRGRGSRFPQGRDAVSLHAGRDLLLLENIRLRARRPGRAAGDPQPAMTDYTIRLASVEDAEAMMAYLRTLLGEPDIHLIGGGDELAIGIEGERRLFPEMAGALNSTWLRARDEAGRIIGEVSGRGDARRAKQHVGVIGISVARGWRDRGLGTALMR